MTTSNRASGNKFEQELAEILAENGFWVHLLQQNKAGQPADIIAIKRSYATLIDCKVISGNDGFPLRRVEENQRYAMRRFTDRVGRQCWFALKLPDGAVHMVNNLLATFMIDSSTTSIKEDFIREGVPTLDMWLKYVEEEA